MNYRMWMGAVGVVVACPLWAATAKQELANELIRCGSTYNALSVVLDHSREEQMREHGAAYLQAAMNLLGGDVAYFNRELQRGADTVAGEVLALDADQAAALTHGCEKYADPVLTDQATPGLGWLTQR